MSTGSLVADNEMAYCICRDITINFQHNLVGVNHQDGEATFAKVAADPVEKVTMKVSN